MKRVHSRKSYDPHIKNSSCQNILVSQTVNHLLHVDTLNFPGLGTRSLWPLSLFLRSFPFWLCFFNLLCSLSFLLLWPLFLNFLFHFFSRQLNHISLRYSKIWYLESSCTSNCSSRTCTRFQGICHQLLSSRPSSRSSPRGFLYNLLFSFSRFFPFSPLNLPF